MSNSRRLLALLALLFSTLCAIARTSTVPSAPNLSKNGWAELWINRPWEMRYVIFGMSDYSWKSKVDVGKEINAKPPKGDFSVAHFAEFFDLTTSIPWVGKDNFDRSGSIQALVMEFNQQGNLTTPNRFSRPLRGRLALLYVTPRVLLSSGDGVNDWQFDLGHWFMGIGDISTDWAPTICHSEEMPDPFSATDIHYKYGPKFARTPDQATFGCREWAHQLYDDARPYIDVTSYVPKSAKYPEGAYIRDFIGWARFGDKKPVIGKQAQTWMCLYDCPNGDKPGTILDVNAWAARNGWQPPKPPNRMPMFPDPPRKRVDMTD